MTRLLSPVQLGLMGFCALLSLMLAWQLITPALPTDIPTLSWHAPSLDAALSPVPSPPADTFARVNDRPIFSPTRKPVTPTPKVGQAPLTPPDASLIGIIIDGQTRLALVRTASSPLEVSVTVGASLGQWTVTAIEPDHISLKAGATETDIRLNANRSNSTPSEPTSNSTTPALDATPPQSNSQPTNP